MARLSVLVPPKSVKIEGSRQNHVIDVVEGQLTHVKCAAEQSRPNTDLQWSVTGKNLRFLWVQNCTFIWLSSASLKKIFLHNVKKSFNLEHLKYRKNDFLYSKFFNRYFGFRKKRFVLIAGKFFFARLIP